MHAYHLVFVQDMPIIFTGDPVPILFVASAQTSAHGHLGGSRFVLPLAMLPCERRAS